MKIVNYKIFLEITIINNKIYLVNKLVKATL